MMAKIENDENLTQFSRRNLKKLGQSFQDEKTLMSMRESRDTPPLNSCNIQDVCHNGTSYLIMTEFAPGGGGLKYESDGDARRLA